MPPPAPMSLDTGTGSALGWTNLATCDSSGASTRSLGLSFTLRKPEGRHPTSPIRHWFQASCPRRQRAKPIPAHLGSLRVREGGPVPDRSLHHECRGRRSSGARGGCADLRVTAVFRRLHALTLKNRSTGSQPVGKTLLSQDVSGCSRTCQSHRTPSPAKRQSTPATSRQAARAA